MKERFITKEDHIFWIEVERYVEGRPIYFIESGWYLGSYKFGSYKNRPYIKHIVTKSITSCVVRHVDPQLVFTTEADASKMMEKMNNESMENR